MTRKRPAQLVDVHTHHTHATLRSLGIASAKDRTLADQRQRKADPAADKPKKVGGNIDDGTFVETLADILHRQGLIVNQGVRGGAYGVEQKNAVLVNPNSPILFFYTQSGSDTATTTNTATTVVAASNAITLGVGKWAVIAAAIVGLSHSTSGTVAVTAEIEGVEGTARTYSAAAAPGVSAKAHISKVDEADWIQGEQTLNIRARFRSDTAGTTTAKNPMILAAAWRME